MNRHISIRSVAIVAALTASLAATSARADTFTCTSVCNFGPGDTLDNLTVKNGGVATLEGTHVGGNIVVEDGGALYLVSAVTVEGNVQSFGGSEISVQGATVGGSIQIKNTPLIVVEGATTGADLQLEENDATLENTVLSLNTIGGNLQLYKNKFNDREALVASNQVYGNLQLVNNTGGTIAINDNTVESALQCNDNESQITGGGNQVGDLECAALLGGNPPGGTGGTPIGGGEHFEDDTCTGPCEFGPADRLENLYVKNGGVATLDGTHVAGNIVVEDGASLFLMNGVVEGNVQSFGGTEISVEGATVGGSIQIKNTPFILVEGSTMEGDLQLEENTATGKNTTLALNVIGGNLQIYKNKFTGREALLMANEIFGNLQLVRNKGGSILVQNNVVESALQCKDNSSSISGCGNTVGDLECKKISGGPCAAAAREVAGDESDGDAQSSGAILPAAGCGGGLSGAMALMACGSLMLATVRTARGRRR